MKTHLRVIALGLMLAALLLTSVASKAQGTTPTATPAVTGTSKTFKHALGETTVSPNPQRIIALEWSYTEDLLALGIQPIAIADIKGYGEWVKIPIALDAGVADVGTRQEPNLEQIAKLKPDLILVPSFRAAQNYSKLSAIAPTLAFNPYPADGASHYGEMRTTFMTIATAVNREAAGKQVLKEMEAKFAEAKTALEKAGRGGETFTLAQAFTSKNAAAIRLFTDNAMAVQIVEQLGLKNAWKDKPQQYGFSTVGLEGLTELSNTNFFYIVQDKDNVFAASGAEPVWNSLPFVKSKRAYSLGGDTWLFGGPLSAQVLVNGILQKMGVTAPAAVATAVPTAAATVVAAAKTSYPLTIKHRLGETTVSAAPVRVAVLDYSFLDALITLKVDTKNIGAAIDMAGGDRGVPPYIKGMIVGVTSVGSRAQPNFETLAVFKPDLIIADEFAQKDFYARLTQIAPTIVYNSRLGSYDDLMSQFKEIGRILDKADIAQTEYDALVATLDKAKTSAKSDAPSIVPAVAAPKTVTVHSKASFVGSLLEHIGRKDAVEPKEGASQFEVSMEGFVALNPARLMIFSAADEKPVIREWSANPLWAKLDAVAQARVYEFDRDLWTRSRGVLAIRLMVNEAIESGLLSDQAPAPKFQFKAQ